MAGRQGAVVVLAAGEGSVLAVSDAERAVRRRTRPGSAIKPFTLFALLREGVAGPDTTLRCWRRLRLAGRDFDCGHLEAGALLDPVKALAYSCNSWFAQAAARLRPDTLARVLEEYGLGSATGLAEDEAPGIVRLARTPEQLQLQAIGEASVEVTPLGLAAAYRRLARLDDEARRGFEPLFAGLRGVVEFGTGRAAAVPGLAVAGKTGTAMSRSLAWPHGWFAGFAPADAPEIVLTVFLENGRGGPDAAPIAGTVFRACVREKA